MMDRIRNLASFATSTRPPAAYPPVAGGGSRPGPAPLVLPLRHHSAIPKLSLKDVSQSFRTNGNGEMLALANIDLQVRAGEFLCIVGPSGCGKSTLLHLIAGLDHPTSGEVRTDTHVITGPGTDRILIFQELGLFPWLTVTENVEFGMRLQGLSKAERRSRARSYLRLVHLTEFEDH
jgi:NitT/TauT family transport system ATP-binding protein